jgi:hypothetical protein
VGRRSERRRTYSGLRRHSARCRRPQPPPCSAAR